MGEPAKKTDYPRYCTLRSIEVDLPLAEAYLNVLFPPEMDGPITDA
jgi:hypothetical protein